jgi:hypothetical protein
MVPARVHKSRFLVRSYRPPRSGFLGAPGWNPPVQGPRAWRRVNP